MISYDMRNDIKPFLLRVPGELLDTLKKEAVSRRISINRFCVSLLSEAVARPAADSRSIALGGEFAGKLQGYIEAVLLNRFSKDLVGIVLFGSAARGELRKSSDIDLLVVLKSEVLYDRDIYSGLKEAKIDDHAISPLIVNFPGEDEKARSIWLEAAIDGCVLYDTDLALSRFLINLRHLIASNNFQRRFAYGVPYWVQGEQGENAGEHAT